MKKIYTTILIAVMAMTLTAQQYNSLVTFDDAKFKFSDNWDMKYPMEKINFMQALIGGSKSSLLKPENG